MTVVYRGQTYTVNTKAEIDALVARLASVRGRAA